MTEQRVLIYKDDDEVLAVYFEDRTEYGFVILKDEQTMSIDGSWTVYSPLADLHEEVIDIDEVYKYIGQVIAMYQPMIGYRDKKEMGSIYFRNSLATVVDQAKTWDVQNKEGK